jgi:hypothetical protein
MERQFWEIFVPMTTNIGAKIPVEYHRAWDEKVKAISGGLTILRAVKGDWLFQAKWFKEKVIPCRILATREEMDAVVDITLEHYGDQHCILAYQISNQIIMRYRDDHIL